MHLTFAAASSHKHGPILRTCTLLDRRHAAWSAIVVRRPAQWLVKLACAVKGHALHHGDTVVANHIGGSPSAVSSVCAVREARLPVLCGFITSSCTLRACYQQQGGQAAIGRCATHEMKLIRTCPCSIRAKLLCSLTTAQFSSFTCCWGLPSPTRKTLTTWSQLDCRAVAGRASGW